MMKKLDIRNRRRGFTLIELLIVIGLLGALTALVLPAMMADRETAIVGICDYNQAGTIRVLKQFQEITGLLPDGLHTGLADTAGTATMDLPAAFKTPNLSNLSSTVDTLTTEEAAALNEIGITKIAYGEGNSASSLLYERLGYQDVAQGLPVIVCTSSWVDDSGTDPFSFDGKGITVYENEGFSKVIAMFIAPTVDWEAQSNNNRWVKGVSTGMELEGSCPIPDSDFAYYVAYVGVRPFGYADYTVNEGSAPVPSQDTAATFADMKTAVEDAISGDWSAIGSWTDAANGLSSTASSTNSTTSVTATYTVTFYENPTAKLLGTSCPECGITNP